MEQLFKFVQLTTDFFGANLAEGHLGVTVQILLLPGDDSAAGTYLLFQLLDIIHSCIASIIVDGHDDCCDPVIGRVLREEVTKR